MTVTAAGLVLGVAVIVWASFDILRVFDGNDHSRRLFAGIDQSIKDNPIINNYVIYNFPKSVTHFHGGQPERLKELDQKNLDAWIEIAHPGRPVQAEIETFTDSPLPLQLEFIASPETGNRVGIEVLVSKKS